MILWGGCLAAVAVEERVRVAAAAGFDAISVAPMDFGPPGHLDVRAKAVRSLADDLGIKVACVDPVTSWLPLRGDGDDSAQLRYALKRRLLQLRYWRTSASPSSWTRPTHWRNTSSGWSSIVTSISRSAE